MENILRIIKKIIPRNIFRAFQPAYHYLFALLAATIYRFPSRHIGVIAITGTKGKTSTTEIVSAILEEAGYRTALAGTLRFKIGEDEERNLYKMTIPGRFFVQRFLRRAVNAKCDWVIIEMTSEGARQFRHKFIDFDALIFTNLSPEHIESHGSFENYKEAKLSIAQALAKSPKRPRIIVANADNEYAKEFLAVDAETKTTYSLKDAEPYTLKKDDTTFTFMGAPLEAHLSGAFNLSNILAGISFARTQNIAPEVIRRALEKFHGIRGRVERVNQGQEFDVVVDYAHTPDSLEKVYEVFQDSRKICVLGGTGGGRDSWKRPAMGAIASAHCDEIILTDEDPYDEDPQKIVEEIREGIEEGKVEIIMDRRAAIAKALSFAKTGDAVIITGKGTDPYIMGPNGTKTPWDDATVAKEELIKLGFKK
ncbi:MAG: UDP-N-acetylmuramyl-tripeptide synthetase [Candidatus Pacebacteria bacterium]|jgi:UDP-N-acetylmuramoyl-L-alanyl-D-glutamate--2,6-diaminopimelate ligase|nr:UDP-N-acetylmuramyl-tripeptide synthetase [Candidatus Paceibacterota bacterium]